VFTCGSGQSHPAGPTVTRWQRAPSHHSRCAKPGSRAETGAVQPAVDTSTSSKIEASGMPSAEFIYPRCICLPNGTCIGARGEVQVQSKRVTGSWTLRATSIRPPTAAHEPPCIHYQVIDCDAPKRSPAVHACSCQQSCALIATSCNSPAAMSAYNAAQTLRSVATRNLSSRTDGTLRRVARWSRWVHHAADASRQVPDADAHDRQVKWHA
jgi:hypothetical protein